MADLDVPTVTDGSGSPTPTHPDFSEQIEGPFVVTFTAHLPFPIGIPNDLGHAISFAHPFVDSDYQTAYGRPFVRIRVFDVVESGLPVWQQGTHSAVKEFYGYDLREDPDQRYGEDVFAQHNQWVSLETPWGAIEGYDADPFHRCLDQLNTFLQAALLITKDIRVRLVSSHDLRPVVVIGGIPLNGEWRHLTDMLMHPGASHDGVVSVNKPFDEAELNDALGALVWQKPYVTTMMWRARAQRALRYTGDGADAVISFQIAAESLLFDTYRMLLIDEGLSSAEVTATLNEDRPFKHFFTRILPERLGGDWHPSHEGTPVGVYWRDLYLVRNSIVHSGMLAHTGHAIAAQTAYWRLRDHLEGRLWINQRRFPRTTLARLGEPGLAKRGILTAWMKEFIRTATAEPLPWYLPFDLGGRAPDSRT